MKNLIAGIVLLALAVFGGGCASSRMDVRERVELPVLLNGQVYTNSFERTDRSKIAPGVGPRAYHRGNGGSFFRFRAEVGGGGGYGYGGGHPVITVPIESQGAFQHQTIPLHGLGGGGSGHYSPTPAGYYSPTPMVGGRYGY